VIWSSAIVVHCSDLGSAPDASGKGCEDWCAHVANGANIVRTLYPSDSLLVLHCGYLWTSYHGLRGGSRVFGSYCGLQSAPQAWVLTYPPT